MAENKGITPDDIESKLGQLKDEVETAAGSARGTLTKASVIGGIVLLIIVFILGSRRGRAGRTIVEVRRI